MLRNLILLTGICCLFIIPYSSHAYEENQVNIHGFISQGYLKSSDNNYLAETEDGTFQFNEFGINFTAQLSDGLQVGIQLFGRDLGSLGNDDILIDWAYADYFYNSFLGIRVGKIKVPVGLYLETRDIDILRTSIFLPQGTYNEGWRDTFKSMKGIGFYGEIPLNILGDLHYQAIYGIVSPEPGDGQSKFLDNKLSFKITDYDTDYAACADVKWSTPLSGLKIGINSVGLKYKANTTMQDSFLWRAFTAQQYLMATNPLLADSLQEGGDLPDENTVNTLYAIAKTAGYDFVGVESIFKADVYNWSVLAEYMRGNLIFAAEYTRTHTNMNMSTVETNIVQIPDMKTQMEGYYAGARYRLTDWFEAGVYYSVFYPDRKDKDGNENVKLTLQDKSNAWQKDWALSTRFDINENWIVKFEAHVIKGTAVMYAQEQEDPSDAVEDWFLYAAKMSYSF